MGRNIINGIGENIGEPIVQEWSGIMGIEDDIESIKSNQEVLFMELRTITHKLDKLLEKEQPKDRQDKVLSSSDDRLSDRRLKEKAIKDTMLTGLGKTK